MMESECDRKWSKVKERKVKRKYENFVRNRIFFVITNLPMNVWKTGDGKVWNKGQNGKSNDIWQLALEKKLLQWETFH